MVFATFVAAAVTLDDFFLRFPFFEDADFDGVELKHFSSALLPLPMMETRRYTTRGRQGHFVTL